MTLPPTASILEAARTMREHRVSSVLLIERGHLFGIVTDRDLRNRALADGIDPARPVMDIATVAPMTVQVGQPAFEALLLMARHNIHHVPVVDGAQVVGMITATDLTEQHSTSAVYLAGEIHKQTGLDGLVVLRRTPEIPAAGPGRRRCHRPQHRPHRLRDHRCDHRATAAARRGRARALPRSTTPGSRPARRAGRNRPRAPTRTTA